MNNIFRNPEKQKNTEGTNITKEVLYYTMPELIDSLGKNRGILEICQVTVAVTFDKATIDEVNHSINLENGAIALTLTPLSK